jgi:hypothetical protein
VPVELWTVENELGGNSDQVGFCEPTAGALLWGWVIKDAHNYFKGSCRIIVRVKYVHAGAMDAR